MLLRLNLNMNFKLRTSPSVWISVYPWLIPCAFVPIGVIRVLTWSVLASVCVLPWLTQVRRHAAHGGYTLR